MEKEVDLVRQGSRTEQLCHGGGMQDRGTEALSLSRRCTPTSATGREKLVLIQS